jgi:ABC-type maltose transport system permease subunit
MRQNTSVLLLPILFLQELKSPFFLMLRIASLNNNVSQKVFLVRKKNEIGNYQKVLKNCTNNFLFLRVCFNA